MSEANFGPLNVMFCFIKSKKYVKYICGLIIRISFNKHINTPKKIFKGLHAYFKFSMLMPLFNKLRIPSASYTKAATGRPDKQKFSTDNFCHF